MNGIRLFGVDSVEGRVPTFALDVAGRSSAEVAAELGRRGVFVWSGNYYAWEPMHRLGLEERGGLVRIGFLHINTSEEVDRALDELNSL
jgi:selenocysteine lyase/cysteine desulfurase